jgi:hypothetical protein
MSRRLYDEDDFDYDEDDHEDVRRLRRPRDDRKKLEKKKPWDRESVPDFDERR